MKIVWGVLLSFFIFFFPLFAANENSPIVLEVKEKSIIVNGKKGTRYQVVQKDGHQGLFLNRGERFNVIVENHLNQPTGIHWHGLLLPNNQDGVPFITQNPIPPGGKYAYDFPLIQSGTFWMHSHYGLQEQKLLAAPLILYDPTDKQRIKEVVLFLSDFTFKNPYDIFKELRNSSSMKHMDHKSDLNDVQYDAFLTNDRTLSNPEIIDVRDNEKIRLRIINGSSSTNFFIQLGQLEGEAIAIDGSDIEPIKGKQFEIAIAQRIDIIIQIPKQGDVFPVLAKGEGLEMQTGLILAKKGVKLTQFEEKSGAATGPLTYRQEFLLKAKNPLIKRKIDRHLKVSLNGDMKKYIWTINGKAWPQHDPLWVKKGERVEILFENLTEMSHPMHLHGHVFQITEINGIPLQGAMRDTVLVLPKSTVKVQFDALAPGRWPFHCHNLYHQYGGMMTTLNYELEN